MSLFHAISLQSGSNGNCIYVKTDHTALLFDAGISGKQAQLRLREHNEEIRKVAGLFLSHDHWDHSRSVGIFQRKFGIPLYTTKRTFRAAQRSARLGQFTDVRFFQSGDTVAVGALLVHTIPTPHDGADGVGFVVEYEGKRLGILTDLGYPFPELQQLICTLDAVFLESNYDPHLLKTGPYPPALKKRIAGQGGHLSNMECGALLQKGFETKLKWAVLAHLSETNNSPELALRTNQKHTGERGRISVASRYEVSPRFILEEGNVAEPV